MALPLPAAPTTTYVAGVSQVASADLNGRKSLLAALKTFIETGIWTRTALDDDAPVLAHTDQDANVKNWIDANGYSFGQVLSETYYYRQLTTWSSADNISMGSPFYLTQEDAGYIAATAVAPAAEIGARMIQITCPAIPTTLNGVLVSCDDQVLTGHNRVFSNLDDAIAVFETTFITDQTLASASSFYAGFHDPQSDPGNFESTSLESCCIVLDYGEAVFEGMTCDGTTLSKATTGVTCVANTLYHLRVEHHGANTPQGVAAGGAVARFFINGVLVLEKTTNMPAHNAWLGPCFGVMGLGSDTASLIHVGPVHWAVNYAPSSQVPA